MKQTDLEKLLADMSLKEKVDQMLQLSGAFYLGDENSVLTGPANDMGIGKEDLEMAGSILGAAGADTMKKLQDDYMAKQPHHIPMLFMMDVIHGMKTIFPAPLAQGATFDPELSGECASAAAKEASAAGLHVTFSPMVDLVRDARWGRVVESTGEDPYLNSRFSEAIVKGFQGDDLKTPGKVASCIKHFAGYGGAVAGRDYNTVELSEHTFREFYLPAYKAGIDAGAAMVMTSFNTINGVPASTNKWLMRDILRGEMGFDGVLISDFAAILETVAHRSSKDAADAAKKALEAGVDIDMMTSVYAANLCRLVEEGEVDEHLIDECCLRILELKNKLGLFENPYKDADAEKEKAYNLCPEHRALAKKAAEESFVLLKNDGVLPLDTSKKIAFVGPYTNNHEIKSSWSFTGDSKDCVTIQKAAEKVFDASRTTYAEGCPVIGNDVELIGFTETTPKKYSEEELAAMEQSALQAAKEADLVVMPMGEHYLQSGEATSRAMIDVPEIQMELFHKVLAVNPNVVVVLFNGRPLDLREISAKAKAILEVWFPGTEGGSAVVDVLTGKKTRDAAHAAFMDKMVRDELAFAGNGKIYSAKPAGDTLAVANRVMNTHREMLDALSAEEKHSSGSPWELQQGSPLQFDVTDQVTASGTYTATFQWKNGPSALKIHSVRLYEGNREVAFDVHEGRTGVENKDNIYRLELKKYRTNLDSYILKAEVSGVSQGASKGEMVLKKLVD